MIALRQVAKSPLFLAVAASITISSAVTAGVKGEAELTPIDLGAAGSSVVLKVSISPLSHLINPNPTELALQIVGPHKGEATKLPKFEALVMSLTGTRFGPLSEQEIARPAPHTPVRLHVTWRDRRNGVVLKDRDVFTGSDWQGKVRVVAGVSFSLDSISLPAGQYDVTVTTLSDDPRFDGTFEAGLCTGKVWQ